MVTYSQQDPRWAQTKYSNGYTIGRYGCTLTDLTMIRDWFLHDDMVPPVVASKLQYASGLIIWASLKNIGLSLVERVRVRNDAKIQQALASSDHCVIVEVNHNHWLWVIGRQLPVLGYRVVDPWDGRIKYTNAYRNNITGCAVIGRS